MIDIVGRVRPGIGDIQPYVPGLTDDQLKHMYGLRRVVKLNANENALGASPMACKALEREMSTLHLYPDGSSEILRRSVAEFHGVSAERVLVGNGSDDIIKLLSETFLESHNNVIMPVPSFSQYAFGAKVMSAHVIGVPLLSDFTYDIKALVAAVTPETKMIYLCSPNNPTGTILTTSQASELLQSIPKDVLVVFDLAYNDYSTHPNRVQESPLLLNDERVVILHTFSKLYGLAGLRVGYGIAHADVWSYVNRLREPFNVNRFAQRAGAAALLDEVHRWNSQNHAAMSRSYYQQACLSLGIPWVETEGNFILLKTGNGRGITNLLMEQGVMVRTGFTGLEEYIRVTFGIQEDNEACIAALRSAMGK